jgi:PilZ domain-containing protein
LLVCTTSGSGGAAVAARLRARLGRKACKVSSMPSDGIRQSDRVSLQMQVQASWSANGNGAETRQAAKTLMVSRNGGVICLQDKLFPGQELTLHRKLEGDQTKTARARIVAEIDREAEGFIYAIAIVDPRADFWDIDFPAPHKAQEALARLLMECSFCQCREVVYLNEMELKSFEIRKCVARLCRRCDSPSIWIEAQSELGADEALAARNAIEERVIPRRNRTRIKARVLACIRRRGFQEEVALCEDLSKGGISFRSRNQYPEGSRLEVAVPYTPGAGAIFVPIRIVFSQPIAAGLFRHGAAYLRPPE